MTLYAAVSASLKILTAIHRAPGATPMVDPPASPPTIIPIVPVPWPSASYGVRCSPFGSYQLLFPPRHLLCKSGWFRSTPVSMFATTTPVPVYPNDQSAGALMALKFHSGSAAVPVVVTGALRV